MIQSLVLLLLVLLAWPAQAARSAWDRPVATGVGRKALRSVLRDVRHAVRRGERPVVVFDIDDTIADGRPRLRRAAAAAGLRSRGIHSKRDLYAGLDLAAQQAARGRFDAVYNDPAMSGLDTAQRGAITYVRALMAAGARVVYVSGRWESQREATMAHLTQLGLPLPGARDLLLNPDESMPSLAWKRKARSRIARRGRALAFFDNEASAVAAYQERFPGARVFRLATFRFGDAPEAAPDGVVVLKDFSHAR